MSGKIEFECPFCHEVSRVPSTFAGKKGKCPACKKVIEVPDPNEVGGGGDGEAVADADGYDPPDRSDAKECKFCGESIKRAAKKCKHCGEFLGGKGGRKGSRGRRGGGNIAQIESTGTTALILSLVGFLACPICHFFAISKANEAKRAAKRAKIQPPGSATAAAIISYIHLGLVACVLAMYLVIFVIVIVAEATR